jgi:hypothetical protein
VTLDDVLPDPHWRTRHTRHVDAAPDAALAAARAVTLREMPLAAVLLAVRTSRVRRPPPVPFVRLVERGVGLAERGDCVWAGVQRPWTAHGESRTVDDLAAFEEPGWVKLAFDLTATADGAGTLLATETRIAATSEDARRAFARYWIVVRLGSGLVRTSWLRAAGRRVTVGLA